MVAVLAAAGIALAVWPRSDATQSPFGEDLTAVASDETGAHYVGREACVRCHEQEDADWAASDHARAMDLATPQTVLGDFADREFTHFGVTSKMFRRGDDFLVTTDNRDGRIETFRVKYVLGYRPLQQYMVEFPDGRIQCLPTAWDTEQKRWYHLYPDEPIAHDDPLHWTRSYQNWNYMCADCHTTDLRKNYDVAADRFNTQFKEMNVSCETCHGPGSLHVKIADERKDAWDPKHGFGLVGLKDKNNPQAEIDTCAPCHTHRRVVYPDFRPGENFLDYYSPALLDGNLYYADGQILEEDYEYTSFIQSRMYHEKVRCTNCHHPHTMRIKYRDNRLCNQCHLSTKYDTPAHHFHPDATKEGTGCPDCHMPITKFMVVDPRRDHSIRVPRPDLTISLGIPNACNRCHNDKAKGETPEWAEQKVTEWYGKRKGPQHFAHAIDAGRKGTPEGHDALLGLLRRKDIRAVVRASAIAILGRYPTESARLAASEGLNDAHPLVRGAAVRALEDLPPEELDPLLSPLLHDPIRSVRTEAARILTRVPQHYFSEPDRKALEATLAEYMTGQESLADQAPAHLNMAVVHMNLGRMKQAEDEYLAALRLDPGFTPARLNLAVFYAQQARKADAELHLLEAMAELHRQIAAAERQAAALPKSGQSQTTRTADAMQEMIEQHRSQLGEAQFSLGLLLAEDDKRMEEAVLALATAASLMPNNPRGHYNLGLAYQKLGRLDEAEKSLATAVKLAPTAADYAQALALCREERQAKPK